jgi:hypothetical protein
MADDNKPHINIAAAAAAAGYGPLAPHMMSEIPKLRVGSIGYDSPIKQICILPACCRYKYQKHSDGEARFMSSSPHHRSILSIDPFLGQPRDILTKPCSKGVDRF